MLTAGLDTTPNRPNAMIAFRGACASVWLTA
jgi:hypothetical protein